MSYYGMDMPFGASVSSPSQAQARLLHLEQSHSRMQQELQQQTHSRATTPMSAIETSIKDQEIASLQQQLRQTEAEMGRLKETIRRQEMTIKTQSEAISNPKQHYATPHGRVETQEFGVMPGSRANFPLAPHPPPGYLNNAPLNQLMGPLPPPPPLPQAGPMQPPFGGNLDQQPWSQSMISQHHRGEMIRPFSPTPMPQPGPGTPYGPPDPMRPFSTNPGFQKTPETPSNGSHGGSGTRNNRGMSTARLQPPPPFPENPTAMDKTPGVRLPQEVQEQFKKVIHMSEIYAFSHVNFPSTAKDQALPQEVKDRLLKAATTATAFQFMSTPYLRYCLVTKIIVQWIIKNILKHDCFAGFDSKVDQIIESTRAQIYQSTPAQVKYQLLSTIGRQMASLKHNPNFRGFVDKLSRARGNELWAILKPMMHQKSSRDWEDLLSLMVEAHHLAQLMYTGVDEYRFDTPQVGAHFKADTMEQREQFKNINPPQQLEAMGVTVTLGMTPHITARRSTPDGHVRSSTVVKAFVTIKADR
ncbi:uncharacterized protein Z518_02043 [Rhinocladiella mackenziei CBS 650.93]|uniref:Uncharacterized protein n=1 Tax=Rhinocladiella mackenziei CBS 650.93 TaxID=1442369 RepID=A0A0D2JDV1_9EURO|nr:uncharacterized protein Z518_02043 [Rhinocladiella mackenziei CBS 650.93]KIX07390.1 hypothetical protein Z518_02043 [Rhinocladiella mackenziei CBS 650.93]